MTPVSFAMLEGFESHDARRKRLGQYFSGIGLARLLGALTTADKSHSIIDPMCGSGDMLAGCLEVGASPKMLGAVEIDPLAHKLCSERIARAHCVLGSAFDSISLSKLPQMEWDIVITNPPYVRYQSMSKGAGHHIRLPKALEVRHGLMAALDIMTALNPHDKNLFRILVSGYSGLADFAVPSWILCAAMVPTGGRLAIVAPESWLSRDYASVVHYILHRWFQIEFIVEDSHATWFDDAQVKTNLIVARRIPCRDSAFTWGDADTFLKISVSGRASGQNGPISNLYPGVSNPELFFAKRARDSLKSGDGFKEEFVEATHVPLSTLAGNLHSVCAKQKWVIEVGERVANTQNHVIHESLSGWLANSKGFQLVTLESLGVSIGQGLRTGANGFFYVTAYEQDGDNVHVSIEGVPGVTMAVIPSSCLLPVLRRQSELPNGFSMRASDLYGRVLDLRAVALAEEIKKNGKLAHSTYSAMPRNLANFVRKASKANIGTASEPKSFCELSAVSPNIRAGNKKAGVPPRFWYMLPDFTMRHHPDVFMARINNGTPKAILNTNREAIVDANFVSISAPKSGAPHAHAIVALLNSAWCRAALEYSASVMGGGALKVEAAHLRRMPLPAIDRDGWKKLKALGKRLIDGHDVIGEIDHAVCLYLLGRTPRLSEIAILNKLADEGRKRRESHKKKSG